MNVEHYVEIIFDIPCIISFKTLKSELFGKLDPPVKVSLTLTIVFLSPGYTLGDLIHGFVTRFQKGYFSSPYIIEISIHLEHYLEKIFDLSTFLETIHV